jgi:putative membrane protein
LVAGAAAAVGMTIFAIGTPIYMPDVMTRATNEFGLFGVTITLIGWLLAASFVLVATTAIGAEFDSSNAPWLVRLKIRFGLVDPGAEAPVTIATERLGLTSDDLAALTRVLVNWLIMIAAVWIATAVVPGIVVNGGLGTYLAISLLFGLVNAVLGPVLYWLAGSQSWLRLGGSAVIVNGILFAATAGLSPNLDIGGLGGAVLGALVVAVASTLLELVFRPIPEGPSSSI